MPTCDLAIDRSGEGGAPSMTVESIAVLLPGVLSFGDDTVAVLVSVGGVGTVFGAVTTIVMFGAGHGGKFPPVRLQVTVPDE